VHPLALEVSAEDAPSVAGALERCRVEDDADYPLTEDAPSQERRLGRDVVLAPEDDEHLSVG
jgi:hypothetical protein